MTASLGTGKGRHRLARFSTFGAVSIATTVLDFGLFNVLLLTGTVSILIANTVSYSAGMIASYMLNKRLTFAGGGREKRSHEIGLFVLVNVGGLWLNNAAVALTAGVVGDSTLLLNAAKLAAGVATWVLKFVTFQRWVYPSQDNNALEDNNHVT